MTAISLLAPDAWNRKSYLHISQAVRPAGLRVRYTGLLSTGSPPSRPSSRVSPDPAGAYEHQDTRKMDLINFMPYLEYGVLKILRLFVDGPSVAVAVPPFDIALPFPVVNRRCQSANALKSTVPTHLQNFSFDGSSCSSEVSPSIPNGNSPVSIVKRTTPGQSNARQVSQQTDRGVDWELTHIYLFPRCLLQVRRSLLNGSA